MALGDSFKLLDLLKATGLQLLAVTIACGGYLLLTQAGLLPPVEPWLLHVVVIVGLLSGALWVLLAIRAVWTFVDGSARLTGRLGRKREREAVASYIPHMTKVEREIIGYLLERNQKSFTCAHDGGYATTLIARGIVVQALRPGHVYDPEQIPMIVPDNVWRALSEHREAFPTRYTKEGHPWRVPWMVR